jgi:hypothetical protein
MSKPKSNAVLIAISLLVVLSLSLWILVTRHDVTSAGETHLHFDPDVSFSGQILVSIIERDTGPERRLGFLIDLDRGEISTTSSGQPLAELPRGGNLVTRDCAERLAIPAPDVNTSAYCAIQDDRFLVGIRNLRSDSQIQEWPAPRSWEISGLAWSANSKAIGVLVAKGRTDLSPIGLLSAASGHPIPLYTFKAVLLSDHLDHQLELPVIRKDSPSGWARIDWIQ